MSRNEHSEYAHLSLQSKYIYAVRSESASFDETSREVKAAGTLGDKPLIVLTAGRDAADPDHLPQGITKADLVDYHHVWVDILQLRLMRLSTRGKRIMVPDSDHGIPVERPDAVVSAVREVFEANRSF